MVLEFQRWGFPIEVPEADPGDAYRSEGTMDSLCNAIDFALAETRAQWDRETDFDIVSQYLKTLRPAKIHIVLERGNEADFDVQVGTTRAGEFIVPWKSESISDLLTNGESYLNLGDKQVFFSAVRDLFFGDNKVFMVCTPSQEVSRVGSE